MRAKFIKTFLYVVIIVLFSVNNAEAREITREEAETLILRLQSVLNRKNHYELERFFKFYSDSTARFIIKNYLVDPKNTNKTLEQEELSMKWDEYVAYIKNITEPNYVHLFKLDISSFKFNPTEEIAYISVNMQEYALQKRFDDKGQRINDLVTLGSTNCNFSVEANTTDIVITSMNCASKILKR